ncbi:MULTISPECIES: GNAT family N-acetyltransferase [unclassified Streptomyces]|uniref:GNAT family N-acetyltransferase n=1 Tax=unclassified Streptomyces TaxID=2593676 RepID=UPI000F458AF8|nr:GNAT family N-acetyltransferase [Streptomyces sp. I6]RNL72131.1 N-acetyltransferase family protein [Streptomyces sp. I6]
MIVVPMADTHAEQVLAVYRLGIEEGDATFETRAPTWPEFDAGRLTEHRFVALEDFAPVPAAHRAPAGTASAPAATGVAGDTSAPGDTRVAADHVARVLGWVAASAVSDRCAYAGVVEHSVYVHPSARGRGVARALLSRLIASTEAAGIWTVQSGVFPENEASLALHRRMGFRVIGTRERIGLHHGLWRDVVLLERRSPTVV